MRAKQGLRNCEVQKAVERDPLDERGWLAASEPNLQYGAFKISPHCQCLGHIVRRSLWMDCTLKTLPRVHCQQCGQMLDWKVAQFPPKVDQKVVDVFEKAQKVAQCLGYFCTKIVAKTFNKYHNLVTLIHNMTVVWSSWERSREHQQT